MTDDKPQKRFLVTVNVEMQVEYTVAAGGPDEAEEEAMEVMAQDKRFGPFTEIESVDVQEVFDTEGMIQEVSALWAKHEASIAEPMPDPDRDWQQGEHFPGLGRFGIDWAFDRS